MGKIAEECPARPDDRVDHMKQIFDRSALELSAAIESRELTCREVSTAFLNRIDSVDPDVSRFQQPTPGRTCWRMQSTRDDETDRDVRRGWMHGLPHAVKDLSNVRGLPTTLGFLDPSKRSCGQYGRPLRLALRAAAGSVHRQDEHSGVRSGVAHLQRDRSDDGQRDRPVDERGRQQRRGCCRGRQSGMVPVADGSDFMGSLRNPPGWNGVLGLRPTVRRSSRRVDALGRRPHRPHGRRPAALLATMAGPGGLGRVVPAVVLRTRTHRVARRPEWVPAL